MWVFAIISIFIAAFILVMVALFAGKIIGPLYDVVIANDAVQQMGYDTGAEVATRIGLKYVLPLLALTLVVWFLVMRLMADQYQGTRR